MTKRWMGTLTGFSLAFALAACDVDRTEDGVEIEAEPVTDVDVGTDTVTVPVPTVDVETDTTQDTTAN